MPDFLEPVYPSRRRVQWAEHDDTPADDTGAARRDAADGHWTIARSVASRLLRAARHRARGERADVLLQLRYAAGERVETHSRGQGVPR